MALKVPKRREKAEQRRLERVQLAETPAQRVNAAFDHFRSRVKTLPEADADREREAVASLLLERADQIRKQATS